MAQRTRRQNLGWFAPRQAPALIEHGGGADDLMGRAAHVHAGVVQNQVFERAETAGKPDQRLSLESVAALAHTFGEDGLRAVQALVEAGERNRGGFGRRGAVGNQGLALSARKIIEN